ncbi:peptide MFS transporter [Alicyclobacillus dauci]|uniref:Peptide MFS transporter n=1 Tax=Alicyclobacillus dauci TaxID=1475485 RepID=A0ABY6Z4N8_9BACL|nr:peptide MFS transporter [Alicyclobacillus dauci]WAH37734.1 peptide MFS transporter [Alicyclobacillus dauci]
MGTSESTSLTSERSFFGHPRGLSTLFSMELWERFSYYGMRAILLYYMYDQIQNGGLGLSKPTATALMAAYGSLVYMSSIVGGWVADRLLGSRRSILLGGILIICGHIALSIPGGTAALFISMVFIILGTGLLKPNVSSAVGDLYAVGDTRRDAGFSIFYMGINIGAFIAPFVVGTLGQKVNYHLGFAAAAVGMALGLIYYMLSGRMNLGSIGLQPKNPLTKEERNKVLIQVSVGTAAVLVLVWILFSTGYLTLKSIVQLVTIVGVLLPISYFVVMFRSKKTTTLERSRLVAYIPLFIAAVCFWVIDEQSGTILATYAKTRTNLDAFGFFIPSSWFQSLNPIFTIILAPTFAILWMKMGRRQPTTPRKFAFGLIFAGISFLIMTIPALLFGTGVQSSPFWLVASYFLVIVGAMCLSPVGLSATTKLAPAAFSVQTMSLWLLSDASAQGIIAQVVPLYKASTEVGYFGITGGIVVILGIVLYFVASRIYRFMQGIDGTDLESDQNSEFPITNQM